MEVNYSFFVAQYEKFESYFKSLDIDVRAFELSSFVDCDHAILLSPGANKALSIFEYLETNHNEHLKIAAISSGQDFHIDTLKSFDRLNLESIIGVQELYADNRSLANLHCRLGHIKEDIFVAEPYLRDIDLLLVDMGALKYNECQAKTNYSPIGLTSEELCNLIYFASNGRAKRMIFYGYQDDCNDVESACLAELMKHLLYYTEKGFQNRNSANLEVDQYLKKYVVNIDEIEEPLCFVMNELSNKWWIEKDDRTIPCLQREYQLATKGQISDNLLRLLSQ